VIEMRYNDTGDNKETYGYGLTWSFHVNAQGHYTATSRDATGLITNLIEYSTHNPAPGGPIKTKTELDVDDRTQYVYDEYVNTWQTVSDSFGRPVVVSDPDSGTEVREYYDSGELKAITNALNERTELEYDKLGRLVKKTTRKGIAGEQVTTFTYDQPRATYFNVGFLTRMNDSAGYREDDYDALGRAAKTVRNLDSQNHAFEFSYNAAGLRSSIEFPDNDIISSTYDGGGLLETETGTIQSSEYDAAGRLKTRNFLNGVVSTYQYSTTRGWVETIDTVKNSTVIQDLTYTYFPDAMVQSIASARPGDTWSWTYTYDDLNRLLTATNSNPALSQSFTYNDIGNMTSNSAIGSYSYPSSGTPRPHAVSSAGTRGYCYNAVGQMTSRNGTPGTCSSGTQIQWNGDGKPSSIGSTTFVYDGLGVRLKKTTGGQTTRYLGGDYEIANDGTITKYLQVGNGCERRRSPWAEAYSFRRPIRRNRKSSGIEGLDRREGGGDAARLPECEVLRP
jgi:YD repeat-containing protein